jgi:threonine aldolase
LEIYEEDGLKELHGIETVLLADADRLIRLEDVTGMKDEIACLLLELPQREIGGQLPPFEELEAISEHCRAKGIKLHLDGARLFEIVPYYNKTAVEICDLFDSVYVSFYKGIGGIAGAILAGEPSFTSVSKVWKRRHGGDLISLYPYILSSDKYFEQRIPKMAQYYREAIELSVLFNECHGVSTMPLQPVSNMFHVHAELPKEKFESALIAAYEQAGVGFSPRVQATIEMTCSYEVTIGDRYESIPKDRLGEAFRILNEKMKELSGL